MKEVYIQEMEDPSVQETFLTKTDILDKTRGSERGVEVNFCRYCCLKTIENACSKAERGVKSAGILFMKRKIETEQVGRTGKLLR